MTKLVLILPFLLSGLKSYEQNKDSVYLSPETEAKWNIPAAAQQRFLLKAIGALAKSECMGKGYLPATSLKAILTIDKKGNVLDAAFPALDASVQCKELLRKEILTMKGWEPGKVKGQNVVSKCAYWIDCIYWQME